ncbi:iron-containing alcohol dehydrogenase [Photobacterium aquimaris]|uniref:Alcohol dehydrogenase n=1 Tax=Photobacterium aquimaris TaxID=512643 RepID=A0A2T3I257_9GAMM|nr:iron-containing alcohol dehydrogenase [Photobacterium aquimaris]OBU26478.1 alcohol dehydrogenase [Photobacterium aquimaris]PQJ40774.1 alcohol dehydrogenase [Photobacterium aquimaris]PSU12137.1 alcohol dehydrogenase [Photobacterium aquimaris]
MFQFMTSTRIIFGEGALHDSLSLLNQFGYSTLLVTGQDQQRSQQLEQYFKQQNMRYQRLVIKGEPLIAMIEELAAMGRTFCPDMVIGIGGGSVLDVAKSLAALIPNQGSVYDYVDVVGRNVPLQVKSLPFIAIPTTAGTGAEVSKSAVLQSAQEQVKVNLSNVELFPDLAIIDPTLTYGMDSVLSGCCAMDAFTHLMEAYVCGEPNPLTDMICEEGLKRISMSILAACRDDHYPSRSDMAFAAMLGGMARSNAKLGAAHGLASSLSGRLNAPHGLITARLAPYVMAENISVAIELGRSDVLARYQKLAVILTMNSDANIEDSVQWVDSILTKLQLPLLSKYGLCNTTFEEVAEDALRTCAIKGNPLPLNQQRLITILEQVCYRCCDYHSHD